ncbi:MAG: FecR domain-containing protein [Burkholderiales bacterium]|nr:FecR domain-containing protein [Burkholderiales bacterium]
MSIAAHAQVSAAASAGTVVFVGTVELVEGDVKIVDSEKKQRTVKAGDKVYEGDSVVTGADGELHLAMEDQATIAVRPNTKMRIIAYRAQGDEQDKGVIGLLVGSLRSITGWIGKNNPKSYTIRTPNATIGVRGTDHEPLVIAADSTEGEAGTYDKVNIGGSYIQTSHGTIDVPAQRAAFAAHGGGRAAMRPKLLESVPRFYRSTRNENLLEKRHELIHRVLEQRLEERRKLIRERIKPLATAKAERPLAQEREARKNRLHELREERVQRRKDHEGHNQRPHGPRHRREKDD